MCTISSISIVNLHAGGNNPIVADTIVAALRLTWSHRGPASSTIVAQQLGLLICGWRCILLAVFLSSISTLEVWIPL